MPTFQIRCRFVDAVFCISAARSAFQQLATQRSCSTIRCAYRQDTLLGAASVTRKWSVDNCSVKQTYRLHRVTFLLVKRHHQLAYRVLTIHNGVNVWLAVPSLRASDKCAVMWVWGFWQQHDLFNTRRVISQHRPRGRHGPVC